jgi:hypothetical protein
MCVCGKGAEEKGGERPVKLLLVCNETLNNAKYPTKLKLKNTFLKNKDLTYIFCGWSTLAMVRLFPKSFSNCNQVVSCFLKNFDRVWKDLMPVKMFLSYQQTTKKKEKREKKLQAGFCKRQRHSETNSR